MSERLVGFSTGTFYKFLNPISIDSLIFVHKLGCDTVEINWRDINVWPRKNMGRAINEHFECTSLHLPVKIYYSDDSFESIRILRRAYKFFIRYNAFRYVVVHPELVNNWDAFYEMFNKDFSLPLAIENMPRCKESFKDLPFLLKFFARYPAIKLVFDVNHWLVNGNSISSISKTLNKIMSAKIQLAGIHLSGLGFHEPLFKTPNGKEIIKSLRNLPPDVPIIIESIFENSDEPAQELAFVREYLGI